MGYDRIIWIRSYSIHKSSALSQNTWRDAHEGRHFMNQLPSLYWSYSVCDHWALLEKKSLCSLYFFEKKNQPSNFFSQRLFHCFQIAWVLKKSNTHRNRKTEWNRPTWRVMRRKMLLKCLLEVLVVLRMKNQLKIIRKTISLRWYLCVFMGKTSRDVIQKIRGTFQRDDWIWG